MPTFSLQNSPAFYRKRSMDDIPVFFYLQHEQLMGSTFSLQPAVEKVVFSQSHSDAVRKNESLKWTH
ncbi:hypothetical protein PBY51_014126 [Eleginops maclovinus]|uniref:Uncharacterized protein n=1 Tax=Eleginops maclovinus TaxID=56733 RepID=A0AAN7ZYC4_ELEMC|nr:hypothetical protein PBY51_014126 [Eleginops maclovinus]